MISLVTVGLLTILVSMWWIAHFVIGHLDGIHSVMPGFRAGVAHLLSLEEEQKKLAVADHEIYEAQLAGLARSLFSMAESANRQIIQLDEALLQLAHLNEPKLDPAIVQLVKIASLASGQLADLGKGIEAVRASVHDNLELTRCALQSNLAEVAAEVREVSELIPAKEEWHGLFPALSKLDTIAGSLESIAKGTLSNRKQLVTLNRGLGYLSNSGHSTQPGRDILEEVPQRDLTQLIVSEMRSQGVDYEQALKNVQEQLDLEGKVRR